MSGTMPRNERITRRLVITALAVAAAASGLWFASTQPEVATSAQNRSAGPPSPGLIEDLVVSDRLVVDMGIIDIRGHVSARHDGNPERFLMSRAMAPELVTASDILEFDLDGHAIDAGGRELFSERFIHSEIYRAWPDVQAVIHAHTPSLVMFSSSDIVIRPMFAAAGFIGDGVPAFRVNAYGGGVGNAELGKALAGTLGQGAAVLMRGHGVVVVGFSLPSVVGRSVHLDANAQLQARHLAMGKEPIYLAARENAAAVNNSYGREWEAWKRKILLTMK